MSEAGDYVPADHWRGHDFKSARKAFVDVAKRSYDDAVAKSVKAVDLLPSVCKTKSESPLVIACDITGSMGDWPATIFSKLPYLEFEGQEYLGEDMEISFAAVGDIYANTYAVQVRKFAKGKEMKVELEKLVVEGGGGGSSEESYDAMALYYARNCECPEAVRKPIFIFIGDEGLYDTLSKADAKKWARADIQDKVISFKAIFQELTEKFSVYIVRKPYNCDSNNRGADEIRINQRWVDLLGADRVVSLPSADRVVDVIFGILAKETGRIDYFEKELIERQGKDKDGDKKIDVVMKSLRTMHNIPKDSLKKIAGPKGAKSKSVTPGKSKASKSRSLMDATDPAKNKSKSRSKSRGGKGKSISLLD
jgi:hypothetical protein